MAGRRFVPLELSPLDIAILRETLALCLEGVRGDLEIPERMPNPQRAGREAKAYERLLSGLERGRIVVPDQEAREAVAAIATATDRENEYDVVVAKHDALHGLLERLTGTVAAG
jgi:hypothetical protein